MNLLDMYSAAFRITFHLSKKKGKKENMHFSILRKERIFLKRKKNM